MISGDYTLTITDVNGCISTENISVGSLVGNQTYKNEIFKIYPNPTDGIFSVVLESNFKGDFIINIFDKIIFNSLVIICIMYVHYIVKALFANVFICFRSKCVQNWVNGVEDMIKGRLTFLFIFHLSCKDILGGLVKIWISLWRSLAVIK